MHVALVSPFDPFPQTDVPGKAHIGGVERVFAEVARRLARRGHDITVVCSSEANRRPSYTIAPPGEPRVVRMPRRATVLRAPVAALASQIPDDADLVQVAATYPFTTPGVLRRARSRGIPSILDFHFEPDPVTPLGRLAARLYGSVGPSTYGFADAVMVRSLAYGRSARSLRGVPEERWRAVPNGIDPGRFCPNGTHEDSGYLLFVGRLVPYKGLHVLFEALARLSETPPPLVVVGDGPMRRELEALAWRLGIPVRFLGRVGEDELPGLYRGARLTVLPSVGQQECFGITLLESMACGTPVVASDIPGVAAVARLGGVVAPSGDAAAWARTLQAALEPGALPRGRRLAKRIHAAYSWEAVTDRVLEVYNEVLGEGGSTAASASPHAVTPPAAPG